MLVAKQYRVTLVIGKFMPFHKGHAALIDFAHKHSCRTHVLLLAHKGECISIPLRYQWLKKCYEPSETIDVHCMEYNPNKLNESSETDYQSSIEWAEYLRDFINENDIDCIVGSEEYVRYMAEYLHIDFLVYDEQRTNIHISATDIRGDILKFWDYLMPEVKQSYVQHICICGSESTGKSTTCKRLEEDLNFLTMIPEVGRMFIGNSELCTPVDLHQVYNIHRRILEVILKNPPTPFMIWDTDNLTTQSYYSYFFPEESEAWPLDDRFLVANKYFFFESNLPFVDDNTRMKEENARELRRHHIETYRKNQVELELVAVPNRYDYVKNYILQESEKLKHVFDKA